MKWAAVIAAVIMVFGLVWIGYDRGRLQASVSEKVQTITALRESIQALSKSDQNIRVIQDRADRDVVVIRETPSNGKCGDPVHVAIEQLRNEAASDRP